MNCTLFFPIFIAIFYSNLVKSDEINSNLTKTFEWLDGGSYTGHGTLQRRYAYPLYTKTFVTNATLFVDYNRHIISIQTVNNSLGSDWIDPQGHWTVLPNGECLLNANDNYSVYLADFRELENVDIVYVCNINNTSQCSKQNVYQGTVSTNCGTHACAGIRTNSQNKVVRLTFQQILFDPVYRIVTKRTDNLRMNTFTPGEPQLSNVQRPCACDNPVSYCNTYYPPGHNYHLCL